MNNIGTIKVRVKTASRNEMVEVTDEVRGAIRRKRVSDGYVIVYVAHTTAAVTINENADPDVRHDMLAKLTEMVPKDEAYYRHGEGNSDSHVKASLVGSSVTVMIDGGELMLGRWQGIYFCEFDGPREREMVIKIVSLDRPDTD